MRSVGFIALLALLPAVAVAQGHVHAGHGGLPPSGPDARATMVHADGASVIEIGPVRLPANAGHDGIKQPEPLTVVIPADGWMHGYSIEIVDGAGRKVPSNVLHHVNVIAPRKRELFSNIMLRVAAAGSETESVGLPRVIGYPMQRGDSLLVVAMFHNPTANDYDNVRLRVRFPLTRRSSLVGAMSIYPFYLDVMPPAGSHSFDVPAGRSEKYWEGRPAIAGRILGLSGHVHKYASLLRLEDRTSGKVLWEAKPDTNAAGDPVAIPIKRFVATFGVGIRPDHVYRLTVVYDNPTGAPIVDGGMGAVGGVFVPETGRVWPAVDPKHPDYITDLRLQFRRE